MNTDPLNGDDWADLAEELGVSDNKPQAAPAPQESATDEVEADELESVEIVADEDHDTSEGTGESDEEEPRKRRRRRRRRKKKAPTDLPVSADDNETSDDQAEEVADEEADDAEADDVLRGESLEDTTPEAARDLIQNWNVPSWEEIVSGLYRPER